MVSKGGQVLGTEGVKTGLEKSISITYTNLQQVNWKSKMKNED